MTGLQNTLPLVTVALTVALGACTPTPPMGEDRGARLFETCAACHGEDGHGDQLSGAPALAGLSTKYLTRQVTNFMQGARGSHPDDVEGLRMRPMSLALERDGKLSTEDRDLVIGYITTSLTPANPEPALEGGNAAKGKSLYAPCTACHGTDGKGIEAVNAPPLIHSNDWYLLTQLKKLKKGIRGGDASKDPIGNQMVAMAGTLSDEQAMKDVIAYIETLSK